MKTDEINLKNADFQDIRSGFVSCDKCGRVICKTGTGIKSFKLVFVCRCTSMGKVEIDSPKKLFKKGKAAIMKDNRLICPICDGELVTFNPDSYVNIGFRIRCRCGGLYDGVIDYSRINKRLKEYI